MISIKVTVMVATLVTLCILSTDTYAGPMLCCMNYIHMISFKAIEGFSVLNNTRCAKSAILFHTKRGREICANPAEEWVMDYVRRLENEAEQVHELSVEKN